MKKLILFTVLMLITISNAFAITSHMYHNTHNSDETNEMLISFFNDGNYKQKNLHASVYIPDLNEYGRSMSFDIRRGKRSRIYVHYDLPTNVKPDFYPAIVKVTNDRGFREVKHTWVEVY